MGQRWVYRRGHYAAALRDIRAEALITDVPFSSLTHSGHDKTKSLGRRVLPYKPWGYDDFNNLARWSEARISGWMNIMVDDNQIQDAKSAIASTGRLVFATIPIVDVGMTVRLAGDGPSCYAVFMVVGRPRDSKHATWGTLPGAYIRKKGDPRSPHPGGKPLGVTMDIIRDYSEPGDRIADTCAGVGTTIGAGVLTGRRPIGAEIDAETHAQGIDHIPELISRGAGGGDRG